MASAAYMQQKRKARSMDVKADGKRVRRKENRSWKRGEGWTPEAGGARQESLLRRGEPEYLEGTTVPLLTHF